jgi:chorismate dehydratase
MMRVGRIGYINCFPVYGAIDRGLVSIPGELVTGTPSELNELLAAGELGVSVISAVEYARDASLYTLLPDLAISSDGPVRSVKLFSRVPVERLDGGTILVSQSSRTSVLLLELLLKEVWGAEAQMVSARAEAVDLNALDNLPHEAVLVIGDAALHLDIAATYEFSYDLGAEWKRWTGLPFVFAVWAARRDVDQELVAAIHRGLLESRDWGLENLDALTGDASKVSGFDAAMCNDYLGGLDYALSGKHIEGLTTFFSRLEANGSISAGSLKFLSVA